jgi:hypothetical protein
VTFLFDNTRHYFAGKYIFFFVSVMKVLKLNRNALLLNYFYKRSVKGSGQKDMTSQRHAPAVLPP